MKIQSVYKNDKLEIVKIEEKNGRFYAYAFSSPFYPDGKGGQLGDRGKIGNIDVLAVSERDGFVVHELSGIIEPGIYDVQIDQLRRKDIAQQHTAQHILSAAFIEVAEIETVSFHMGEEYSTIDLDIPFVEPEVTEETEDLANRIVQSCTQVEEIVTDFEGVKAFELRKPLSDKVKGKVRLIKIANLDISACGGFHVDNTGEIGVVKIIDLEKVKGNLTRVYFVAGVRAVRYFRKYNNVLKNLSRQLTSSIDELNQRVEKIINELREKSSLLSKVSQDYAELLKQAIENNDFVYFEGYTEVGNFLSKIVDNQFLVFYDGSKYIIGSKKYDVRKFVKALIEKFGGKGGGKEEFANYIPNRKLSATDFETVFSEVYNK
ncbi:threonyl-tRNA synthetase [Fervidobacterium sp. SC_NGM5_O18]|uniref:Alanyl-tRNA editing protein n=2 Tax=Fervidobacterium pennivorans TaxID=93466 RepID=A0A7V4CN62_FERPE|nr:MULTISPECIES: alanyl-tRNA editing protein [Fervidobacterium]NPU89828.1 alanyl-tRNA editing protein [Fervidobacterium sp.]PHJ13032.1 threonyl-tRNA synthetase [Fervidobacterium sp. SC_NGM5_O18]